MIDYQLISQVKKQLPFKGEREWRQGIEDGGRKRLLWCSLFYKFCKNFTLSMKQNQFKIQKERVNLKIKCKAK
jgi:hypothetical protein